MLKSDADLAEYVRTNPGKSRFYKNQTPTTALPVIGKRVGESDNVDQVIDGYGRIKQAIDDGKEYVDVNLSTNSKLNTDLYNQAHAKAQPPTPRPPETAPKIPSYVPAAVGFLRLSYISGVGLSYISGWSKGSPDLV